MSRLFRRRRAFLVAENQRLTRENTALRDSYNAVVDYTVSVEHERDALRLALADLGRRLHAADTGPLGDNPLGDTVPLLRIRSHRATAAWPPKEWTT